MNAVPVPIRKLKAQMALKDLTLLKVSELSGVEYSVCSRILNGRVIHPEYLRRIKEAIQKSPAPDREVAA